MTSQTKTDAYADALTAIFSLAAIDHGHETTRLADFHRLMVMLRREFPADLPAFDNDDKPACGYSSLLADALHRTLYATPPRILTDDRKDLVVDRATAARNLNGFDPFTRQRFVKRFAPIARRFVALQRAADPPESA